MGRQVGVSIHHLTHEHGGPDSLVGVIDGAVSKLNTSPSNIVLSIQDIPDGDVLTRSGAQVVGTAGGGGGGGGDYVGYFDQATAPTTGQVPTLKWAFWFNTVTGKQFLVRNRAGTMFSVEMQ